ncbi:hypothetical protein Q8F55_006118 [Vanrija albida]|uniref:ABC transporter domain-containing protein n=1 Tax=Vanrija albida TaxID=181172 RepID=A0ABR3Q3G5_9TREE
MFPNGFAKPGSSSKPSSKPGSSSGSHHSKRSSGGSGSGIWVSQRQKHKRLASDDKSTLEMQPMNNPPSPPNENHIPNSNPPNPNPNQNPNRVVAFACVNLTHEVKGRFEKPGGFDDHGNELETTVVDRLKLLDNVSFTLEKKQALAILGPSGSGKSTLFKRVTMRNGKDSHCRWYANSINREEDMSYLSSFVEQNDHHLGVLTVRETLFYAAKFSGRPVCVVDEMLADLGLELCADVMVGDPLHTGISGGQKRRLSIGCALMKNPEVLFLDEPISGLDATSADKVIKLLDKIRTMQQTVMVVSLHSPSETILRLFSKMMVLAAGKVAFMGTLEEANTRCEQLGVNTSRDLNPANVMLGIASTEWRGRGDSNRLLTRMFELQEVHGEVPATVEKGEYRRPPSERTLRDEAVIVYWLCHRYVRDYIRNWFAFLLRMGMFAGMGLLLATIWIRLGRNDDKINDRLSVHFFSVAFLSFMSVAGIPAFIEERKVFLRERRNALYGPLSFLIANTLVVIPFVFACSIIYSAIIYWAIGLHPGAVQFFRFVAYLFLALLVAETQSALIAALVPIFVAALALCATLNGFWMCVQGYFIRTTSLPRFWYYSFHFMDYQTYAFELLVKNDLVGLAFNCVNKLQDGACNCVYPPSAATISALGQCHVSGQDVIDNLGFGGIPMTGYAFVLVGIFIILRVLLYIALRYNKMD